jgi:3-hydroxyisobutyrate dehydrogenase-like beta-hydroxyacid dehydrogenase
MDASNVRNIAFIGFGEVGQTFAAGLLAHDGIKIAAFDIEPPGARRDRLAGRAEALGVTLRDSAADAAQGSEIVISAVTASAAERVAEGARAWLAPGQFYFDVNSAAPSTKQRAARHVEAAGAHYVEGAVMAAVLKPGLAVPILAGGPMAEEAALRLNALGMNLTPVAVEHGRASAMKLCRSIVIKGIEALMVDCAAACEGYDVKDPVFASLRETFPSIDWHVLAANCRERVAVHGVRRAAEMREAGEMLQAIGMAPDLANAVADAQLRGAGASPNGASRMGGGA